MSMPDGRVPVAAVADLGGSVLEREVSLKTISVSRKQMEDAAVLNLPGRCLRGYG